MRLLLTPVLVDAAGALPAGTRVEKVWSPGGDTHERGSRGTIYGSRGPLRYVTGDVYCYWVQWDADAEGTLTLVSDLKIRPLTT